MENIFSEEFNKSNYDSVVAENKNGKTIYFVKKNGLNGIVSENGAIIVPIKYIQYSDMWAEWEELGFPTSPVETTRAQKIRDQIRDHTNILKEQGRIISIKSSNDVYSVICSRAVKLSDGKPGIASSIIGKGNIQIIDLATKEIVKTIDVTNKDGLCEIDTDDEYLYVATYNAKNPIIACYKQGSFELVWKKDLMEPINNSLPSKLNELIIDDEVSNYHTPETPSIQAIAAGDKEIAIYDVRSNSIYFLNKENGEMIHGKVIPNAKEKGNVTNLQIIVNKLYISNRRQIIDENILKFKTEICRIDDREINVPRASIDDINYSLKGFAIDKKNQKVYIALDDVIGIIGEFGFEGFFTADTRSITNLSVDSNTGNLLISMQNGKGQVDVYTPGAIEELVNLSEKLKLPPKDDKKKID